MMKRIARTIANGAHSGAVTHHQLQEATVPICASLRIKKMKNSVVPNPIVTFVVFVFVFVLIVLCVQIPVPVFNCKMILRSALSRTRELKPLDRCAC